MQRAVSNLQEKKSTYLPWVSLSFNGPDRLHTGMRFSCRGTGRFCLGRYRRRRRFHRRDNQSFSFETPQISLTVSFLLN